MWKFQQISEFQLGPASGEEIEIAIGTISNDLVLTYPRKIRTKFEKQFRMTTRVLFVVRVRIDCLCIPCDISWMIERAVSRTASLSRFLVLARCPCALALP